jgi:hypothetical protein
MKARSGVKAQSSRQISAITHSTGILKTTIQRATPMAVPTLVAQPDSGLDVWISARQARDILGVGAAAMYRLANPDRPFVLSRRPLPKKVLISLRSVTALADATKNPLFWYSPELQEAHFAKLKRIAENVGLKAT